MKWLYIVMWIWLEMSGNPAEQRNVLYYQEFTSKKDAMDYLYAGKSVIGGEFNVYRKTGESGGTASLFSDNILWILDSVRIDAKRIPLSPPKNWKAGSGGWNCGSRWVTWKLNGAWNVGGDSAYVVRGTVQEIKKKLGIR